MSRRVQRTKAREDVPTEDKEDSGSDSSALDRDSILEMLRKQSEDIAKQNEAFQSLGQRLESFTGGIDEAIARAMVKIQQENETRLQQESTKLEAMVEGKLDALSAEVSGRLTAQGEDINERFLRIVDKNQEMNEHLRKDLQEVNEKVKTIEKNPHAPELQK